MTGAAGPPGPIVAKGMFVYRCCARSKNVKDHAMRDKTCMCESYADPDFRFLANRRISGECPALS